jgi:hypothetical protein
MNDGVLARLGDRCNSGIQEMRVVNCIVRCDVLSKLNTTIHKGSLSTVYILHRPTSLVQSQRSRRTRRSVSLLGRVGTREILMRPTRDVVWGDVSWRLRLVRPM